MKSNINMTNGIVKSGEFKWERKNRTLEAYGSVYTIPVKTVAFGTSLEEIVTKIGSCRTTAETVTAMLEGIALFIGKEETEKIFPASEFDNIDVDEVLGFWRALYFEFNQAQQDIMNKYVPAANVRK